MPKLKEGHIQLGIAGPEHVKKRIRKYQHQAELDSYQEAANALLEEALTAHGLPAPEEKKAPESK